MTATVVDIDPDTERDRWLDWRRGGVGASDVAAILGISPWDSPWSIWADRMGLLPPKDVTVEMEAGHWLERAIGPWFAHRTGLAVVGEQVCCERPDSIARCSADLFVAEKPPEFDGPFLPEEVGGLAQIKTAGFGKKWETIPEHYQAQAQWEMYVTGLDVEFFAVLMGRRLDVHELQRDDADIALMVERVDEFWAEHVVTGVPPATDGHDATLRALAAAYPEATPGKSVELVGADLAALQQWQDAKAAKSVAVALEKEAAAALEATLGDAEEATVAGERVLSWREQTRKSYVVQESTFRVLRPVKPSKVKKGQAA